MLSVVIGGSGSGKSAFAEKLLSSCGCQKKLYIATMEPVGEEGMLRVRRHQKMREGKGFITMECYTGLENLLLPQGAGVLLECMGNLVANEMFSPHGVGKEPISTILRGITHLCHHGEEVIVVTNDVFSDGIIYDKDSLQYLEVLAQVNTCLSQQADRVVEIVCGIPIIHKGDLS